MNLEEVTIFRMRLEKLFRDEFLEQFVLLYYHQLDVPIYFQGGITSYFGMCGWFPRECVFIYEAEIYGTFADALEKKMSSNEFDKFKIEQIKDIVQLTYPIE